MTIILNGTTGITTPGITNQGVVEFTAGSVGAPSLTTTGDTNTGIYFPAADTIAFTEGGVESMRINSSGNLGLGVTPSPWDTLTAFDIGAGGGVWGTAAQAALGSNVYFVNPNFKYKQTNVAAALQIDGNIFKFFNAPSGTAGDTITFTQAMTLDASGQLGIGTSSPGATLDVAGNARSNAWIGRANGSAPTADAAIYRAADNTLGFSTANTERARITAAGDLLVGTTTTGGKVSVFNASGDASQPCIYLQNNKNFTGVQGINATSGNVHNDTGHEFLNCNDIAGGGVVRMTVRSNGGIANYSANDVNLSDERTKKDIAPLGSMWNKFKAIEIVKFKYKDQTHDDDNIGVIAQQVESVAPEFVDIDGFGETPEDGVPLKSIYTADMYHAAIKALQEAMARIETLEAKVTALESK